MAAPFKYAPLLPYPHDDPTEYEKISDIVPKVIKAEGQEILQIDRQALVTIAEQSFKAISHYLRTAHLQSLANILTDPEASDNDKFVALDLIKNACIAAQGVLPSCQDTGTAVIMGKKGQFVWTDMKDEEALSEGVYNAYTKLNLRYSQMAPLDMYKEVNTKNNLPAQIELYSVPGNEYRFLMIAKGGGSANKSYLYQETAALLNPESLTKFITEKVKSLGTAACPPYHLALVVGGTSAEFNLKCVKLASTKYLDGLPTKADGSGSAYRDLEMEKIVVEIAQKTGIGAQFGGKYLCHDARVIRLPRHGASCPVGLGVSCSADRQIKGKITKDGVFIERLEKDPMKFLPAGPGAALKDPVQIDLTKPMKEILATLSQYPIQTRLSLSGTMVVARDLAHAKLKERLSSGGGLPDYLKNHPVYYAGPAKQPPGMPSGSFGPTTAGRMDTYVDLFQQNGGSMIMVAKGNRSKQVTEACKKYGGFYLGSIGGPAARLAQDCIKKVEVLEYPELGMEAVWRIEVVNFPAFIIVDDKGNDFFETIGKAACAACPAAKPAADQKW